MNIKKLSKSIAIVSALTLSCSLFGGCSLKNGSSQKQSFNNNAKYKIGICQFVKHPALDKATKGFKDYLTKKLGKMLLLMNKTLRVMLQYVHLSLQHSLLINMI